MGDGSELAFVFVRSTSDIVPTCETLNRFFRCRRSPSRPFSCNTILGFWLEPRLISTFPGSTQTFVSGSYFPIGRVLESLTYQDKWMLCWLRHGKHSRTDLVKALDAWSRRNNGAVGSGYFLPVFPMRKAATDIRRELVRLDSALPDRVLEPIFQNETDGSISPPKQLSTWNCEVRR